MEAYPREKQLRIVGSHGMMGSARSGTSWLPRCAMSWIKRWTGPASTQLPNAMIDYDINDVEIEMRKSKVIKLTGPHLQPIDDPVRIGYVDEHPGPVVIWTGIKPDSQVSDMVN